MNFNKYKVVVTFLTIIIAGSAFAQKHDKKFKETFNVNKDVVMEINASNTDIDVSTWNKNQVQVEATIEVEGLTKEEAEKYLKNYKFEAMGNSKRVEITSKGTGFYGLHDNIVIFNDDFHFPEVVIPDIDIDIPEVEAIVIPDMHLDKIFEDLDELEFDFDKYKKDGETYFFEWKDNARKIKIKSKEEWEKFKKSDEYKKLKAEMKASKEKLRKELKKVEVDVKKVNKEAIEKALKQAKIAMAKVDIQKELDKARKHLNRVKKEYYFNSGSDDVIINDKKIKVKKRITIKVPKGATFDLNTRHCKVKLPTTTASGKVSYGEFIAEGLAGGDLNIYYAPVTIRTVNKSDLSLHNVTDATIASVTNTSLSSSSGELKIDEVFSDVNLESSFGELTVKALPVSAKNFNVVLKQSDARIDGTSFPKDLIVMGGSGNVSGDFSGNFSVKTKDNRVVIKGKYSSLKLIK